MQQPPREEPEVPFSRSAMIRAVNGPPLQSQKFLRYQQPIRPLTGISKLVTTEQMKVQP